MTQSLTNSTSFNLHCKECRRLADFLAGLRQEYPLYHNLPVAPFGDPKARFLIVGLAPGLHGANATGRPFTGDYAGEILYNTLYKYGFSNQAYNVTRGEIKINDDLQLHNCRISNAVKCLPPQNKPTTHEINTCNRYLAHELSEMPNKSIVLGLGLVAHKAVLKATAYKQSAFKFAHKVMHELQLDDKTLYFYNSYHCSRYNTSTKRLTEAMFHQVFADIRKHIDTETR